MKIFSQGWSNGFDGPGRRLVFYLKGCNFSCLWCGNPESISAADEMLFYPEKSMFAEECCPYGAVSSELYINRKKCKKCTSRECVNVWNDPAFEICGRDISVTELVAEVLQRRELFGSDGGVTFSGGEPTLQWDELLAAAKELKHHNINLAIETNASSSRFPELAEYFDTVFCDLKCVSRDLHIELTGLANDLVLSNLRTKVKKVIRIPLVKDLNFTDGERLKMVDFLKEATCDRVELIRLHHLGLPKYKALGLQTESENMQAPELSEVKKFAEQLREAGITCNVQG